MASLKVIKTKIRATVRTRQVTKAMEAVSAAKMRKSQQRALGARHYAAAAVAVLSRLAGSRELVAHALTRPPAAGRRALYIVITSDKGLAGALNSGVLRGALADIQAENAKEVSVIAVGRKAQDFFSKRGYRVEAFHPNTDDISSGTIRQLVEEAATRFVLDGFATDGVDEVKIVYQNFVSTFEQRPVVRSIFPLSLNELQKVVGDISPRRGAFAATPDVLGTSVKTYTIEPNEEEVLKVILPKLAGIFVYHALLESQASEHSARMVAMKSASDKALEMTDALALRFNKARQAAITREMSEIISGTL